MTNPQLDPSESEEHEAAMAVCSLLEGLADLVKMARESDGRNIVCDEISHLESAHEKLTVLLALLKQSPRLQVVR